MGLRKIFGTVGLMTLLLAGGATAQDYPAREIHSVAGFPPGSGMDIMIRYFSAKLAEVAGKPVVVDNKPGAAGNIGTEYVARAKPDGYTIMITPGSSTLAAATALFKKLPFDPVKDFQPVMMLAQLGFVIVVPANSPARSMSELTTLLKNKPDHGSFGAGANTPLVIGEMYKARAGLKTVHVSYRTASDLFNDLYGGQLDFAPFGLTAIAEPIRAGKLRALAVTSATRLKGLPDVPTMQEAGFSDFDFTPWIGLFAPAGTPAPIVEKLAAWHRQISATEETKKALQSFGMDPLEGDAAAMAARLKSDIAKWAEYVRLAKIEPQ